MDGVERMITISLVTKKNEIIPIEKINKTGIISIQTNKSTKIKYNKEEVELKRTRIFTREDVISNMNIVSEDDNVKLYIVIRYKENTIYIKEH